MSRLGLALALAATTGGWGGDQVGPRDSRYAPASSMPQASRQGASGRQLVRVAAAANLRFALDEAITRLAARQPALDIRVSYGSSGNMHAQLRRRAPYDLFLAADAEYPRDLVARGVGAERDLFTYAVGRLVLWVRSRSTLPMEREGLHALEQARRIAIANPFHAPYGRAAEAALRHAGIWERVRQRVVLGENVTQAAQFVQGGAADAGIIAKSLAVAPALRAVGRFWEVPAGFHPPIVQVGLILPWAGSREAAERFRDFLVSEEGRMLLASYGFGLPAN